MTPTEIIAAHTVLWSIDGNIQCRCKALMRHDDHPEHIAAELGLVEERRVVTPQGTSRKLRAEEQLGARVQELGWWIESRYLTGWGRAPRNQWASLPDRP